MFTLPSLPYAYDALEPFIDTQTMQVHHDKHHQAYIDNLNKVLEGHDDLLSMSIEDILSNLSSLSDLSDSDKIKIKNNAGGHANHSMFWNMLGPAASSQQSEESELQKEIIKTFGSFDQFKEKFTATALGRFGSGWAWLSLDNGKLRIEGSANQDSPLMEGRKPILCLDVWEHAYYLKYQNRRKDYVEAWWNVVNWSFVEKFFI